MKKKLLLLALAIGLLQSSVVGASTPSDGGDGQPGLEIEFEQNGVTKHIFIPLPIVYAIMQLRALQNRADEQQAAVRRGSEQQQYEAQPENDGDSSRFKPVKNVQTKFSDVGGAHAAKRELQEVVDFLQWFGHN